MKPRRPCKQPGCPGLAEYESRHCKAHREFDIADRAESRRRYDRFSRDPEDVKFYHSQYWIDLRGWVLARHPLCVVCRAHGITTAATEVDHIVPRRDGGPDTFDNLQSLCGPCHKIKTVEDSRRRKVAANG